MQKLLQKKFLIPFYVIGSFLLVVAIVKAATTIGSNIITGGTLSVTGATTLSGNLYSTKGALFNYSSTTALSVQNAGTNAFVVNTGGGSNTNATTSVTGYLEVASSTATTLYVDPVRGRIGIGTTAPGDTLHIITDAASSQVGMLVSNTSADPSATTEVRVKNDTSAYGHFGIASSVSTGAWALPAGDFVFLRSSSQASGMGFSNWNGGPFVWVQGSTERMRMNTSGFLGIGTANAIAMLNASSTAATTVAGAFAGASGQTNNILNILQNNGTFLSGFTASGGLLINVASTTALVVQDGSGNKVFEIDTSSTPKGVTITGQATTTGNFIVGTTSWAAPTNTMTIVGTLYTTGNATTSGDFVVGNRSTSGTTSVDIMSGAAGSGNACISMRREGADYRIYINGAGTGLVVEAGECE